MNKSLNHRNFLKIAGVTALNTVPAGCTDELIQSANRPGCNAEAFDVITEVEHY
ncbi:MAG: hypothetical protein RQ760_02895 [Sedimentisphaerales bacterium]|nr:hypothetical protein [Sedimentisphaerales bacterium]